MQTKKKAISSNVGRSRPRPSEWRSKVPGARLAGLLTRKPEPSRDTCTATTLFSRHVHVLRAHQNLLTPCTVTTYRLPHDGHLFSFFSTTPCHLIQFYSHGVGLRPALLRTSWSLRTLWSLRVPSPQPSHLALCASARGPKRSISLVFRMSRY